ncbi:MAG: DegT/DnrJ/EryC1/StrS aminotransferase family protein [Pseudomonadota bacterium]
MFEKLAIHGGNPISEKMILFGKPKFGPEEEKEILETLRSGWIGFGSKSLLFEEYFKNYVDSGWALSVSSCTAALHLALLVNGVQAGDEVITTPLTFAATINAIHYTGAKPVLADIEPDTFNIEPEKIEEKITSKTKAILPVHYGGLPVDMDAIEELAQRKSIKVVYDAAHAVGAHYKSEKVGSRIPISCFSFYPNKNMTTIEGGMLSGNNHEFVSELKSLRMHGLSHNAWKRYNNISLVMDEVKSIGFKYNFSDLQAALGIPQLAKLDKFIERRTEIADYYEKELKNESLISSFQYRDKTEGFARHALHLFVIVLNLNRLKVARDTIACTLRKENIGVAVHYLPVFKHKYFREKWGFIESDFPIADKIGDSIITLPISPALSDFEIEKVVLGVKKVLRYYEK